MKRWIAVLPCLLLTTLSLAVYAQNSAAANASTPAYDGAILVEASPALEARFGELANMFHTQGTSAVAESMHADLNNPDMVRAWQQFARGAQARVIEVKSHPNEQRAIEWINKRFVRMGVPNLQFKGTNDPTLPDPTFLDLKKVKGRLAFRYFVAGCVAMAPCAIQYIGAHHVTRELMDVMLVTAGGATMSVVLELQFAALNQMWQKVWRFGGPYFGRVTNLAVNYAYPLAVVGAQIAAAYAPLLFGHPAATEVLKPVLFGSLLTNALIFSGNMGQFQPDLSTEIVRGSVTSEAYFTKESVGVAINGGGRMLALGVGAHAALIGYATQGVFFLTNTLPQALKTHVVDKLNDREFARVINPEMAPKRNFVEKCALILKNNLPLINMPQLSK